MKKITLFVCALATAVASFAGTTSKLMEVSKARQSRVESQQMSIEKAPLFKAIEEKEAIVSSDTIYIPYATPRAYHYGLNSNGIFYNTPALYVMPYAPGLVFYNDYNFQSTWLINGQTVAQDTALALKVPGYGEFNNLAPVMQTPKKIIGDTAEYIFPDYQYGAGEIGKLKEKYPTEDFSDWQGILNAPAYITPITRCAILSENPGNYYYPFDYGTYSAATGGDYWYGTKLVNNFTSDSLNTYYMDTTAVLMFNPGFMYIDQIKMGIYTRGNTPADMFPGENDHIRLTLYPMNQLNGFPDWNNPIASATAGKNELTGTGWNGILTFSFLEEDPVTHNFDTVPATVEGNFWVVLDEYNDGTASFGFLSDDEMTTAASTYFFFTNPATGKMNYTTKYRTPANLDITLRAYMPSVADAPEAVYFQQGEELTKTIALKTNTYAEDYDIDAPSWVNIEAETVYDPTTEDHTYVVNMTITVDANNEAREGEVIITDFSGYEFSFIVKQNIAQGLENVSFKNNNKLYNVLGQEVGEDYKGVVIRNGEKFIK